MMAGAGHHDRLHAQERVAGDVGADQPRPQHDVGAAVAQHRLELQGRCGGDGHPQPRPALPEAVHQRPDGVLADLVGGGDPQHRRALACLLHGAPRLVGDRNHLGCGRGQAEAALGERGAALRSDHQLVAELLAQRGQRGRDGRHADPQLTGGRSHRAVPGDRSEGAQLREGHDCRSYSPTRVVNRSLIRRLRHRGHGVA